MLRFGKISSIDPAKCYARVKFTDDEIVSDWLQIVVLGAISNQFFHIFDINEQVACLMDENSEEGVILGAVFNDKKSPSNGDKDVVRVDFSDNSFIEYNRNSHEYTIDVKGKININSTGETKIEAQTATIEANEVSVNATAVSVDAETVSVQSTTVGITAAATITGNLIVSGSIAAASISAPVISGPGVSMSGGNLEATGELKGSTVKAGTVDLGSHVHAGVQTGSGSTAPPTP